MRDNQEPGANPPPIWHAAGRAFAITGRPSVMGIVNATPDSFSDGGAFLAPEAAERHARQLIAEGADILDIGGESSRPGAAPVPLDEERRRVLPVIEALAAGPVPVSIDTAKPELAAEAVARGAAIINDIGGLRLPEMLRVIAESDAGLVLMHMAGTPQTMQNDPRYANVVEEVYDELARQVERAERAGVARHRVAVDPGIGFGKRSAHNLALLRNITRFTDLGCAVLIGTSRKSFLGSLTNRPIDQRLASSVVSSLAALVRGASVVRVHDVAAMRDTITVWNAIMGDA